ncbi:MAG: hypothetical protein PHF97_03575 [Bacteroidales bacterium]|nr:hypothetical protein [Bacteroidales bacterium]
MEMKEKKSINHYMRSLHRDIGFFVIGLTIIYSISGIVLIYRDTDFLKHEKLVEKQLSPNIKESDLGMVLHLRNLEISKTEGDVVYFQNGTYNSKTGIVKYTSQELPSLLNRFIALHFSSSRNLVHWFSVTFGILLLFLAISSFWMFKPQTKLFHRGIYLASAGIICSIIILLL